MVTRHRRRVPEAAGEAHKDRVVGHAAGFCRPRHGQHAAHQNTDGISGAGLRITTLECGSLLSAVVPGAQANQSADPHAQRAFSIGALNMCSTNRRIEHHALAIRTRAGATRLCR